MKPNGPAKKGRLCCWENGGWSRKYHRGRDLIPAGMNEAWRGFWSHGTNPRA